MSIRQLFLFAFVLSFAFSCSGPSRGLDEDERRFAGFYADYLLMTSVHTDDATVPVRLAGAEELDSLLSKHGIGKAVVEQLVQRFESDPERWRVVLEAARDSLQASGGR
ncbi:MULTISPECIES: hypothetical protein [Prosthecochloris]|uniref:DUF4296 domain-containing protein n=1 Tax=Prosthecochloris vibrioformis TaxID=1098 RepID=A0A5C4S089_PROVB|nr:MULTISPECIES: hypothetical protein [Prosthecochloris]ANT64997.1 hypothetical protein Ptc2401_01224 [Prosthecochloris sp. CIB 2401]TNJ36933.1 hypothetical protein FGF68_05000 [Prosthecochloris vibrioformis]